MDMIDNVIKAMNGDQEAISELYYATYPKLRAVAVSILKNEDDAEDIVQDSYIKAFSSLHQLDNAQKFEPWLCRILSNKCKDYLKKNKPILFSTQNDEDSEPIEWSIEDESKEYNPEEVLISADTRKQIMDLLNSLPDEQRICLIYYVVEDMKISEIAKLLEVSENTVKSRISYAKSKMQVKINDLEKKGVKLRGFAGFAMFPFIRHLFSSQSVSIPAISPEIISSSVATAAETTATASKMASAASKIIGKTTKTVAGQVAKHLGVKIASVIVAVAVTTTAIIGITHPELFNHTSNVESELSESISSDNEIKEVSDDYIKGVFYLAKEMYDKHIYPVQREITDLNWEATSKEHFVYNGCVLQKLSAWDSYNHFVLNLENQFSKAAVSKIVSDIQLIDYEGVPSCNAQEGVGNPVYNYTIEYVQQVSELKYRIHISFLLSETDQLTTDMYCIYEDGAWVMDDINFYGAFGFCVANSGIDLYDAIDILSKDKDKDVFTSCEDLLCKGTTESGLNVAYYAYIDLNDDEIPELLVADADGTPNSWSICEIYTYKNNELKLCGRTNSRYDYFYLVNEKYVLGKHRMGDQFISIDKDSLPSSIETSEPIDLIQNCFTQSDLYE